MSKTSVTTSEMKNILKNSDDKGFWEIYDSEDQEGLDEYVSDYLQNSDEYELDDFRG